MALLAHLSRAGALACRPALKRCRVLVPVRAFKGEAAKEQKSETPVPAQTSQSQLARPETPLEVMPFRRMTEALLQMQNEMDAVMDHFGLGSSPFEFGLSRRSSPLSMLGPLTSMPRISGPMSRLVPVDVQEEKDMYKVTLEVPGFTKNDIKVTLDPSSSMLTITGQKAEAKGQEGEEMTQATSRFSFTKSFSLPQDVDINKPIKARTEHGLLTVELPKGEQTTPQVKEIAVE